MLPERMAGLVLKDSQHLDPIPEILTALTWSKEPNPQHHLGFLSFIRINRA